MGQMASTISQREQGRFPSQPEVNPREHEKLKAITSLRSGKIIDNNVGETRAQEEEELHEGDAHVNEEILDDKEASTTANEKEATDLLRPIDLEKYKERKHPFHTC